MDFEILDNKNFIFYCIKHYDNPHCTGIEEFNEDMSRIKYIKKLFTRYIQTGDLKERLILNHIVILNNVFGPTALSKILFFKLKDNLPLLKPFLIYIHVLPETVNLNGKIIYCDDIPLDQKIVEALRVL